MPDIQISQAELQAAQAALGHVNVPVYKAYKRSGTIYLVTRFGKQTYRSASGDATREAPKDRPKPKRKPKSGDPKR